MADDNLKYDKEQLIKSVEEQLKAGMSERDILNRLAEAGVEPIDARLLYLKVKRNVEPGVKYISKHRSIAYLIFAVLFGLGGIVMLALGLLSLPESKEEKMRVTTLQTTAVVIDKRVVASGGGGTAPGGPPHYSYWVSLDFNYSDLAQERIALLNQQQQSVQIRFKSDYDNIRIGKTVTVVYRTPEAVNDPLCVESVAGYEIYSAVGDLAVPRGTGFGCLAGFILAFVFLAAAGVSLYGYYEDAISCYAKRGKFPFGRVETYYFVRVIIFLKALGLSLVTLFFAGFIPAIMVSIGAQSNNWLLILFGLLVFSGLFYLIGRWSWVGLWKAWRDVLSLVWKSQ